ncbi:MAG: M3 family metallopeptidase [Deltaproteobacteria bacterium]|jgi:oligoendopeptidase F|nr:M3 family metallopeptidase [Deltaproteobacteria bacterium]
MKSPPDTPHWILERFFPEGKRDIGQALTLYEERVAKFVQGKNRLEGDLSAAEFLEILREYEEIYLEKNLLHSYVSLSFDQARSEQGDLSFLGQCVDRLNASLADLDFFAIWWRGLPEERAQTYIQASPGHRHALRRQWAYRKYALTLEKARESDQSHTNVRKRLINRYRSLTDSFVYTPGFLPGPERPSLSPVEIMGLAQNPLPEFRVGAYKELWRVHEKNSEALFQIYRDLAKDWHQDTIIERGFSHAMAPRNLDIDLKDETVESFLRVCQTKVPEVFGRYFKQKAKRLGLPILRLYDLHVPVGEDDSYYGFGQALNEVEQAFRAFDPEFADLALNVPRLNRLSGDVRVGKPLLAYCQTVNPGVVPWVSMVFQGRQNDVFHLARKLAFAAHAQLASNQSVFEYDIQEPLSHIASHFAEFLLTQQLMKKIKIKDIEALRFSRLDLAISEIGNNAFGTLFEIKAHQMINQGTTVNELSEVYLENLKEQFGKALKVPDEFRWEWLSASIFFIEPFLGFTIAFERLLAYGLWDRYQTEGAAFAPKFKAMLAMGSSDSPEEILKLAGLGPLDDDFWLGCFKVLGKFIREL